MSGTRRSATALASLSLVAAHPRAAATVVMIGRRDAAIATTENHRAVAVGKSGCRAATVATGSRRAVMGGRRSATEGRRALDGVALTSKLNFDTGFKLTSVNCLSSIYSWS